MTRASVTTEQTFDVPELATLPPLELQRAPRARPGFVTGVPSRFDSAALVCRYCGTTRAASRPECATCGSATSLSLSPSPSSASWPGSASWPPPPSRASRLEPLVDAMTTLPFGFWKRVPFYALLAMVLGNGCRCGGLSSGTNLSLAALLVVGLVGVGCSLQRNP